MASSREIASYVFFDTETTGLYKDGHKPTITELCFLAIHKEDLVSEQESRVVNKLLVCLDPEQPVCRVANRMSGLSRDILRNQKPFNRKMVGIITNFLAHLAAPVCLIAHNGNRFDFPLLRSELLKVEGSLSENLLCADSIEFFRKKRDYTGEKPYSLENLYERFFEELPPDSHSAESDCTTLLKIVEVSSTEFTGWVNEHAVPFRTIQPMYL